MRRPDCLRFFYGRSFRDLEDLNAQLAAWRRDTANAWVHGTTGEIQSVLAFMATLARRNSTVLTSNKTFKE